MRKHGAFLIEDDVYRTHETPLAPAALEGAAVDAADAASSRKAGARRRRRDRRRSACVGFPTPSRKLEFYSKTLSDWGWPEHALPGYIRSHVHWPSSTATKGEMLAPADLPAADADPHALRQREVAQRDLAHEPALAPPQGRRAARASRPAIC